MDGYPVVDIRWQIRMDYKMVSLALLSVRKVLSCDKSTTASFRFMEMSLKWSSSLWSLAKLTNT